MVVDGRRPPWHETNDLLRIGHCREPPRGTCKNTEIPSQSRAMIIPSDTHAPDSIGDCDGARVVRAPMEYGFYRRPLRPAIHRAIDLPGFADGLRHGHHGRHRTCRGRTLASCE